MRDRSRSAKLRVLAIARASRNKTEQGRQKMKKAYLQLLEITSRVTGQAKKFSSEIAIRVKHGNLSVMHKAKKQLDEMIPRVQQVLRQTRERVLRGNTKAEGKLLSIFETHTEVIRKGKAHKPNEFGKLVLIQEAENQIVTHYVRTATGRLHLAGRMSGATCRTVRTRPGTRGGRSRILLSR
jgi:transposase, IS5 family